MNEEKRIYVVVAETVYTPNGVVVQPCGRVIAQACHVVSKMRLEHARATGNLLFKPFTAIILSASDNRALYDLVETIQCDLDEVGVTSFLDANREVYGVGGFRTAICTYPVTASELGSVLEHLPLWSHDKTITESLFRLEELAV